ncbi:unnamed protein product [Arabis nemorensis]|uniref:Uncharacterized protein n=1 Tax=Arabis nemorensis TaxID=586526 RepID=A0A565BMK0_9BRAS|nr:unnamed protein product [Arabis nemorensis]
MSHWPHYPPCVSGSCDSPSCCAQGAKFMWKELRGKKGEMVKRTIEKENPNVTVVIVPQGIIGIPDFCCNRVRLYLDSNGNVFNIPQIG